MIIIGLDPARPLIDRFAGRKFKLSKEDAHQVQVLHTNAGFLGEVNQVGHVDFCINGGTDQPNCKGHRIRKYERRYVEKPFYIYFQGRARCSHFQSACYYAQTIVFTNKTFGRPCKAVCPKPSASWGVLPGRAIPMGEDTPFG